VLDLLLVVMVLIWAGNYSLVKHVLQELPPLPFNALRLAIASAVFGAGLAMRHASSGGSTLPPGDRASLRLGAPITRHDWHVLVLLGLVGHCGYQLCFIAGLARTTVANSALISGCTPVAIGVVSALVGHERLSRGHWAGVLLSLAGVYLVAGQGVHVDGEALSGDLLILASVGCWTIFTVFSQPLLNRLSPFVVTATTMIVGSVMFVVVASGEVMRVDWRSVSAGALVATTASALLALNLSYLIWYTSVQRLGSGRTSVFSNMVPPTAMAIAAIGLGEHVTAVKWIGAGAVLAGVLLTRMTAKGRRRGAPDVLST
jgi:drug/metabolite transporter (DMT)-like permease